MKKLLFGIVAFATLLFAASCQQESLEPVAGDGSVTYTVQMPGSIATKAVGDDLEGQYKLIYEVYRASQIDELDKEPLYEGTADFSGKVATVQLQFVKRQDYKVLFWAQSDTLELFNTTDLREVSMNSSWKGNDLATAVFAGTDEVSDCVSAKKGNVTLVRPVSQINIATSNESLSVGGTNSGQTTKTITMSTVTVAVKGLHTTYNVWDKEVEGVQDVSFTEAEISTLPTEFNSDYKYVAMNYVGFAPVNGTTVDVDFSIVTSEGEIDHQVANVPIKANYRTNILGNLITETNNYTVEINTDWADEEYTKYVANTAAGLQELINEAEEPVEISLTGDITLGDLAALITSKAGAKTYGISIAAGKDVVLDLNGYSISDVDESLVGYSMIYNNGNLTIQNSSETESKLTLKAVNERNTTSFSSVITNGSCGVLNITENITVEHLGGTYMAYGIDALTNGGTGATETVIDGTTIKSTYRAVRQFLNSDSCMNELTVMSGSTLIAPNKGVFFQDPSAKANKGKLVIENGANVGTVYLYVAEGSTEWPVEVSIAASSVAEDGVTYKNVPKGYVVEEVDGFWAVAFHPVAKIGEKGYATLNDAVAAVQDGETITLVADELFTNENYSDNGGWKDGLGCYGDKSFTLDLNNFTLSQNGALNDYLIFVKNNGEKENVITIKNGTVDAGTTAYCALCTSSSHTNKVTINLENITLINNITNGSTLKIRGGAEVNVNAGTKIIGKNSYLGIECNGSTVNINEGAEIYMNGTGSYNGCLAGVGYNGVINVNGGYGKGVKGGFIAMTSGGTINVNGGEWIANTDGSIGGNSNFYVLTAQSNSQESGFAGGSYINVTGGTLRGGMDAWVLNANNPEEEAGLCISGGNFNADPRMYLAANHIAVEAESIWTVKVDPVATVGDAEFATFEEAVEAAKAGDTIELIKDVTLTKEITMPADVTINGNGKQINGTIYAGGNLTFAGHTKVSSFSASYYNRTITIGEGACLEITGGGRVTVSYGNKFNIIGSVENAKTADKSALTPSLIVPAGLSFNGNGGDVEFNVTNAYIVLGNTTSKNSGATGTFNFNFTNSIAEFTNQLLFSIPTNGKTPTFNVNLVNSVLTTATKLGLCAPNTNVVLKNSHVNVGSYLRNSAKLELTAGSTLNAGSMNFGEHGGHDGITIVDASTLNITTSNNSAYALDGQNNGKIVLRNNAEATIQHYKALTIENDGTSTLNGTNVQ